MELDDDLCLCFHVTKRKVVNYLRIERPRSASQLSECYGAGTGCGWCRTYLKKLFEASQASSQKDANTSGSDYGSPDPVDLPSASDYARDRANYVRAGGGTPPPGATPVT